MSTGASHALPASLTTDQLLASVAFGMSAALAVAMTARRLQRSVASNRVKFANVFKTTDRQVAADPEADPTRAAAIPQPTPLDNVSISNIRLHKLVQLGDSFESARCPNINNSGTQYNQIMGEEDFILNDIVRKHNSNSKKQNCCDAFVRAGPRSVTHFAPQKVRAAIVTCGGLCPGLNNVIREIVHALMYLYDVETVYGIRFVICE
jgi:hypothetical protein